MDFFERRLASPLTRNPPDLSVRISRDEYDDLVQTAQYYTNLRTNLLSAGIHEQTIQHLCDSLNPQPEALDRTSATVFSRFSPEGKARPNKSRGNRTSHDVRLAPRAVARSSPSNQDLSDSEVFSEDNSASESSSSLGLSSSTQPEQTSNRETIETHADRSIELTNLPQGTTLADVVSVVRGGQLIEVFLRRRDNTASVSFVHGEDAVAFYHYVLKHDLYIKNKRVEIRWNDYQHVLPGHVAHKIRGGATRNLVISPCNQNMTEQCIRDDLEHIHNLAIVYLYFMGGDCYIGTNAVTKALFARACMLSRLKYRGCRIDWTPDECDQSLDQIPHPGTQNGLTQVTKRATTKLNPKANRFECLDLEA